MNIVTALYGDRKSSEIALIHRGDECSYGELHIQVNTLIRALEQQGVQKGSKIMLLMPVSINFYMHVLALFKMGACVVFPEHLRTKNAINTALKTVPCDFLLAPPYVRAYLGIKLGVGFQLPKAIKPIKIKKKVFVDTAAVDCNPNDHALVSFTSGSGGHPKAANRTHGFLKIQNDTLKAEIDFKPNEKCYVSLPVVVLTLLSKGATVILPTKSNIHKLHKKDLITDFKDKDIKRIIAAPDLFKKIQDTTNVKFEKILLGGAAIFPDQINHFLYSNPEADIEVFYGSTECEPISKMVYNHEKMAKDSSLGLHVGALHPALNAEIVLASSEDDYGELVVSGPQVLPSYINCVAAQKANKYVKDAMLWHKTGDLARIVDGQIYLLGRENSVYKHKNKMMSSFLVESKLRSISGVEEGTIVRLNDEIHACIVAEQSSSESNIVRGVRALLEIDCKVHFCDEIPKDIRHNSKINHVKLKQFIQSRIARKFNPPNVLSLLRLLSVPVLIYLAVSGQENIFLPWFIAALLTDIADGFIARRFNYETEFGARLDSTADEGMFITGFVGVLCLKWIFLGALGYLILAQLGLFLIYNIVPWMKFGRQASLHTYANKFSGYLMGLFVLLLFLTNGFIWLGYIAISCSILAHIEGIIIMMRLKKMRSNVKGLLWM